VAHRDRMAYLSNRLGVPSFFVHSTYGGPLNSWNRPASWSVRLDVPVSWPVPATASCVYALFAAKSSRSVIGKNLLAAWISDPAVSSATP
jgi:hypothetical protein